MAETKKTAAVKPVAKPIAKAAAVKAEDAKSEETKTETVAAVKEAPKAEEKKPAAKKEKTAAKKSTTKKTAEKKTTEKKTTTKAPAKQAKDTAVVHVQFSGKTYTTEDLIKSAKDVWQYDLNRKPEDFKTIELYVKPEESLAYYVINGDVSGSFYI